MAEPASSAVVGGLGLGISVLALATLFNTCFECLRLVDDGRGLGKDSIHLAVRLQVEKIRFFQWGHIVGLTLSPQECRLGPHFYPLIRLNLASLASLFQDASRLNSLYGLKIAEVDPLGSAGHEVVPSPTSIQESINADLEAFHKRVISVQHESRISHRFKWAIRDASRFRKLVEEIREANNSLQSVLELGRQANLSREVFERILATDVPQGLETLHESLTGTPYTDISAAAEVKRHTVIASTRIDEAVTTTTMSWELDMNHLATRPADNVRRYTTYQLRDSLEPVKVVLEWKEYPKDLGATRMTLLNVSLRRLAACLRASSGPFHCLDLLGYVRDPEPAIGNPRIGLLYKYPNLERVQPQPVTLLELIIQTSGSSPALGDRFILAQKLATAVYHLLASSWLHKGIRAHNVLFFQQNHFDRPYIVGFDYSRLDDSNEYSARAYDTPEFNRYRHPEYLKDDRQSYKKVYDIYAFGVVLVEIAYWTTAKDLQREMKGSEMDLARFARKLRVQYTEHLATVMGAIYMEAVQACLVAASLVEEPRLLTWFREKILSPLETCKA